MRLVFSILVLFQLVSQLLYHPEAHLLFDMSFQGQDVGERVDIETDHLLLQVLYFLFSLSEMYN